MAAPAAGGFGPPPGLPTSPGAPGTPGGGTTPRKGGNLRRNAVWAFVGALLASAGWTTAVLVVPDLVSSDSSPRSLGSYHLSDDFCATAKPSRLLATYSVTTDANSPSHNTDRTAALDSMNCSMSLKRTGGGSDSEYASVYIRADLHKAVNPAPEQDAGKEFYRTRGYQITDIPGLGEAAFFIYKDDSGSGSYHSLFAEVQIRDGAMTYSISYNASYTQGKSTPPSMTELRNDLQTDADNAVRAMRK
ncbi:hypothetical protein [Streptomyces sp. CBMA123]|uniref:hypothetical protein n=1 Tax=Streptomyces sp. CBMA123 TaxID=1896313 RepID=UPI0016620D32|nr:hypothetical protein [Streptomyces sp. CBMA123]MBD0690629.1 hypothetical protein [Streptomyces sp. CBMA123]